jgi:cellulose synthase/poly-beta-1,6-N-acetylglucosamine synthase-like glycosyltransferase
MIELIQTLALFPTAMLLMVVLAQYAIATRPKPKASGDFAPSISVIVPAHNEGKYIESTVKSLLAAEYDSGREIIVVNDGSTDETGAVLTKLQRENPGMLKVLETNHVGKSRAINTALGKAKNEVIVIIDGDSELEPGALKNLVRPLKDNKVAAVGGIVKVKNYRKSPITWFQRLEYLYSSFFNSLCDRIDGNIFTPGPISAFRRDVVAVEGGFNTKVYLEDVDMALRIIRQGYRIRIAEDAIVRTNVPESVGRWAKQRRRWMRGGIETIKNHKEVFFKKKYGAAGFFPLPLLTYWYMHAIINGIAIFGQVFGGYYIWFYLNGAGLSVPALQYFIFWFSALGIPNLAYMIISGAITPTPLLLMSMAMTLLSYPLYLYPYLRYKEKFGVRDAFALFFIFPYWIMVLVIQTASNIGWFKTRSGGNWWTK